MVFKSSSNYSMYTIGLATTELSGNEIADRLMLINMHTGFWAFQNARVTQRKFNEHVSTKPCV